MEGEWTQLTVLIIGLWCMGAGTGFERSLLPRMAVETFSKTSASTRLNFVASFGASKAIANAISGPLADRFGRKFTLVIGFLVGLPVMPYIIFAQTWTGIIFMNIAFGLSQGLLGSSLFMMMIDVMGPSARGIAVGVGECSIYLSTALLNILAGRLATRYGYRPVPFWVATGFAVAGLLSTIPLKDTLDQARSEQQEQSSRHAVDIQTSSTTSKEKGERDSLLEKMPSELEKNNGTIPRFPFQRANSLESYASLASISTTHTTYYESIHPTQLPIDPDPLLKVLHDLASSPNFVTLCLAGMIMNLKDGFAWGSFPNFFSEVHHLNNGTTDALVALYPMIWGFAQAFTGFLSDKLGRKLFLKVGISFCTVAMVLFTMPRIMQGLSGMDSDHVVSGRGDVFIWVIADILLGLGTAMAYPALQAGAADEIDPINRGIGLGCFRFIRDMGYVVGALICGPLTDSIGYESTFLVVAAILAVSFLAIVLIYKPLTQAERWKMLMSNERIRAMADTEGVKV